MQKFEVFKYEFQADSNLNFRWPYLLNGTPVFAVSFCIGFLLSSSLSLASVRKVLLLFVVYLLLFLHNCIIYMLIGSMFARIDCPEFAASFCEDCDRLETEEWK